VFFGALVLSDAGVSADEAVHLVGAIGSTVIVAAGLIPQLVAAARNTAAFQQAFMAAVAVIAVAGIVGDPDNYGGQAGPFDVVYLIFLIPLALLAALDPARRELVKAGTVRPALLLIAAMVAVPLFVYAVDQGLVQRNSWPPKSDPHHNSHWFVMAELAFAIPLKAERRQRVSNDMQTWRNAPRGDRVGRGDPGSSYPACRQGVGAASASLQATKSRLATHEPHRGLLSYLDQVGAVRMPRKCSSLLRFSHRGSRRAARPAGSISLAYQVPVESQGHLGSLDAARA
jgi:hypothetical protein